MEARCPTTPHERFRHVIWFRVAFAPYNPQRLALDPGTRLGRYEILSALGAGGTGEVYKARDPRLGRDVAMYLVASIISEGRSSSSARR